MKSRIPRLASLVNRVIAVIPVLALAALTLLPVAVRAQGGGTGTITGRILNEATGQYLSNAEITIVGTNLVVNSEDGGYYRVLGVPAGEARISVNYSGLDPVTASVMVAAGQTVTRDVGLTSRVYDKDIIKMGEFVVSTEREGNAKAIQEQRQSLDMKTVLAADAFGDVSEGNVGEFLKMMPGVYAEYTEADVRTISLGGMDPKYTIVLMDGAPAASANSSGFGSRVFEFEQLSTSSIETIELSKTPTPDVSGSALAGVVNLRSKGAFDRKGRSIYYNAGVTMNSFDMTLGKTPGWDNQMRSKVQPNLQFEYSDTYLKNQLGVIIGYSYSFTFSEQKAESLSFAWDNDPSNNATEVPRVTTFAYRDSPKPTVRKNYNTRIDYKITPDLSVYVRLDYNTYMAKFFSRDFNVNFATTYNAPGAAAAYIDPTIPFSLSSQTAVGTSSINQGGGATNKHGYTSTPAAGFSYKKGALQVDGSATYSRSTNWYTDLPDGFWWSTSTGTLSNLKFRFDRAGGDDPSVVITQLAGPDWRRLSSYANGFSAQHTDRHGVDEKYNGRLDFRYAIVTKVPIQLKWGYNMQESIRSNRYLYNNASYTHVGPDGVAGTADDAPALYAEPYFVMGFRHGGNMDGVVNMDRFALGQEFKNHPEYWTPPTRASVLQTQLQNLNKSREQITAYYLEPIFKITPKFDIAPGVRLENTRAWGSGASSLTDPLTRLALTGSKTGVVDTTSDAYIITRYSPKAGYTNPYDTWLKYLHASYRFTKNLTGRLSYNDSVTRPDLNRMVTGITINNDTAIPPTATVNNTDLKPERARNMSAGLDYYTRQAGYFTMFFARHDMMDKIVTDTVDIDPGGSYLGDPQWGGWRISTAHNVTKSHSSSLELTYQTPQLDFLPSYLRGLSLYTNYSENYYDNYENYRRPRMGANGRLYYRLGRFAANWNTSWVPTYRNSAYSATGVATFNTYRITHDVGASFQLRRNLSLTFTGRNVLNAETGGKTFSNRPDIIQRWIYTGSVWKVGLSGNF